MLLLGLIIGALIGFAFGYAFARTAYEEQPRLPAWQDQNQIGISLPSITVVKGVDPAEDYEIVWSTSPDFWAEQ